MRKGLFTVLSSLVKHELNNGLLFFMTLHVPCYQQLSSQMRRPRENTKSNWIHLSQILIHTIKSKQGCEITAVLQVEENTLSPTGRV